MDTETALTEYDPNIEISETRVQRGIAAVDATNLRENRTWGGYIKHTVRMFELTQEVYDAAVDTQLQRMQLLLPDIQIAEGLKSEELLELKRATIIAVERALKARRQTF